MEGSHLVKVGGFPNRQVGWRMVFRLLASSGAKTVPFGFVMGLGLTDHTKHPRYPFDFT